MRVLDTGLREHQHLRLDRNVQSFEQRTQEPLRSVECQRRRAVLEIALQCRDDIAQCAAAIIDRRMLIERARETGLRDGHCDGGDPRDHGRAAPHGSSPEQGNAIMCECVEPLFSCSLSVAPTVADAQSNPPSPSLFHSSPAPPQQSSRSRNQSPSVVLPTVIVTAQKDASDVKEVPASVTAVTADDDRRFRTPQRSPTRRSSRPTPCSPSSPRARSATRASAASARARQPGDHHLSRRRAAAQQQLVEHRAARRQPDRIRARPAEPAVRPQHARRHRQRDLGAAVDVGWTGSVIAPFGNAGLVEVRGNVSGPLGDKAAISFAAGKQQRDGFTENSVTGNDLDSRDGTFAKAQAAVPAERELGSAGDLRLRAQSRRRLRARRSERDPHRAVPRGARLTRASPTATSTTPPSTCAAPARTSRSRARPASSPGTPRTKPISTTRRCRWRRARTWKRARSSRSRSASRRRTTRRSRSARRWSSGRRASSTSTRATIRMR